MSYLLQRDLEGSTLIILWKDTVALTIPVGSGKASEAPYHCPEASAAGLPETGSCGERGKLLVIA
jgi:hypothetical protein